jgi:hypothetical protein
MIFALALPSGGRGTKDEGRRTWDVGRGTKGVGGAIQNFFLLLSFDRNLFHKLGGDIYVR